MTAELSVVVALVGIAVFTLTFLGAMLLFAQGNE